MGGGQIMEYLGNNEAALLQGLSNDEKEYDNGDDDNESVATAVRIARARLDSSELDPEDEDDRDSADVCSDVDRDGNSDASEVEDAKQRGKGEKLATQHDLFLFMEAFNAALNDEDMASAAMEEFEEKMSTEQQSWLHQIQATMEVEAVECEMEDVLLPAAATEYTSECDQEKAEKVKDATAKEPASQVGKRIKRMRAKKRKT